MTGLGIVAVIAGFLIGAFAGAAAAFGIIWVLVQIMEVFMKGFGYIFLAGGIAMLIWWLIECFPKQRAPTRFPAGLPPLLGLNGKITRK